MLLGTNHVTALSSPTTGGAPVERVKGFSSLIVESAAPYNGLGRLKAYINPGLALNDKNARYNLFTAIGKPTLLPLLLVTLKKRADLRPTPR